MVPGSTITASQPVTGKNLQQEELQASDKEATVPNAIPPHSREKERLFELENFEKGWFPVRELRPPHKLRLKKYTAKKQKQEGQTCICEQCGKLCGFSGVQIHHRDHDTRNNQLPNLAVFCDVCNEDEKKRWLSQLMKSRHHTQADTTTLRSPKEKEIEAISEEQKERILRKAPWTSQKKVEYRHKILVHLIENIKGPITFYGLVADSEAISGCSHDKAIEYLDAFSNSVYSPYAKFQDDDNDWMLKPRTGWDVKYATEEYKNALKEVQDRKETESANDRVGP
jgi:hypothetical protein